MFQTYKATTSPATGAARVAALRQEMARLKIDGFMVPRADIHQGEYVPPRDERLAWLTGFTGSAGQCIVLTDVAGLFVDGRYTLQARAQSDAAVFSYLSVPADKPADWVVSNMRKGDVLGYDPRLHTRKQIAEMEPALQAAGINMRPIENVVDAIWQDQPAAPLNRVNIHPPELAGQSLSAKQGQIADALKLAGVNSMVLTLPDSIAWLLNIRGTDIAHNPVPLCFAVIHADASTDLFIDDQKIDDQLRAHLGNTVRLNPVAQFEAALPDLAGPVGVDEASAPIRVMQILQKAGTDIKWMRDPCLLPKACKNEAELAGMRAAHLRDAGAMAEFLCWLEQAAPSGTLTEIDAAKALETYRQATGALREISFDTISGAGPNGAIVHYRVNEDTNRTLEPGELFLIDSGGQYVDGTTDITRTVATGPVEPSAKKAFTLVLKGMVTLSLARWPEGLAGRDLDALARNALWQAGMDYDHGTGHGVGAYLSVHEGPQNISRRGVEPLRPGMVVSNEPGYYREGAFGIRIENLVAVTPPDIPKGGERAMLGFETLTLAPIDRRLIDVSLLTTSEIAWLNAYHARVAREVTPLISQKAAAWLAGVTRPL